MEVMTGVTVLDEKLCGETFVDEVGRGKAAG